MAESRELAVDEALEIAARAQQAGDLAVAETLYGRILAAAPDHVGALHHAAILHHRKGNSREALRLFRRALALAPETAVLHSDLGNVLFEIDRPDLAIQAYEEAIRLDPGAVAARNNLGVVLRALRSLEAAEAVYREAIALDPNYRDAFDNLGRLLAGQGRIAEAIACHARALELEPANAGTRRYLVAAYAATGETDKALALLRQWVRDEPESPAARHLLAAISGEDVPERASERYVTTLFDGFATSFDHKLARLDYRVPELIAAAVGSSCQPPCAGLAVLDAGCGTGLCAPALRPFARDLVGVDLSGRMLERAALRGGYDRLEQAELTAFLSANPATYDLVVCADTLCYFGLLDDVFRRAAAALRPGGLFIFSVEDLAQGERFVLHGHGRYAHVRPYVERSLEAAQLEVETLTHETLRMERGEPVAGLVVTARRSAMPPAVVRSA